MPTPCALRPSTGAQPQCPLPPPRPPLLVLRPRFPVSRWFVYPQHRRMLMQHPLELLSPHVPPAGEHRHRRGAPAPALVSCKCCVVT